MASYGHWVGFSLFHLSQKIETFGAMQGYIIMKPLCGDAAEKEETIQMIQKCIAVFIAVMVLLMAGCSAPPDEGNEAIFFFPSEEVTHEGTWLTWPHKYADKQSYYFGEEGIDGEVYVQMLEPIWIEITKALHTGETVHIIAYNAEEQARIEKLLQENEVDLSKIDFVIIETDDVWMRDTGPIFTLKDGKELAIANFIFDGYGNAIEPEYYAKDAQIAANIASLKGFECIDIDMVLEGGSVEVDGHGTLIAAKSSVVGTERNTEMRIEEVEAYLKKYYGVTNIIWIEGLKNEDITDGHIDACVKFAEGNKLVTLPYDDFMWYCSETEQDWEIVSNAVNADGVPYEIVEIPLTETFYEELEDYGCYLNYYVGNEVVLVPIYGDVNDQVAMDIIASLYPTRRIVGINCLNLALFGGMVHCVTQQQPALDAIISTK
jgi:agmatine deiminase